MKGYFIIYNLRDKSGFRAGAMVKLLSCDLEVMGSSPVNSFLQK